MYPDDSLKDLSTVLSHMAGRPLSKEQISKAMELPRSTHYDQREKGDADHRRQPAAAAANLGINRAELLTRYRLIYPERDYIGGRRTWRAEPSIVLLVEDGGGQDPETRMPMRRTKVSRLRPRHDAPPL